MVESLKLRIAEYLLKKRLGRFSRSRELKNLKKCHSVLILSSESDDSSASESRRLISYFKLLDKEVFCLFYEGKKPKEIPVQNADIKAFNKSHLNKIFIPKDSNMLLLMDREFDLLIDLTIDEIFTLKYIHALSRAKLKVGAALNYKKRHGDLTIDIKGNPNVVYLITQIKHYLTQINQEEYVS